MPRHKQRCDREEPDGDDDLIVYNAVKRAVDFSRIVRDSKNKKGPVEASLKTVANKASRILNDYEGGNLADILSSLAELGAQRIGLPNNKLGMGRARQIFAETVGDPDMLEPCIEYVSHGQEPARIDVGESAPTPTPSVAHGSCDVAHAAGDGVRTWWPLPSSAHGGAGVSRANDLGTLPDCGSEAPASSANGTSPGSVLPGPIYLLEFARSPKQFLEALMAGPELQECRDALELHSFSPMLESGAKAFVHPGRYEAIAAAGRDWNLKPRHIIVAAEFEGQLAEALGGVGLGVAEKGRKLLSPPPTVVKRTFIHVPIASSLRSEPSGSVVVSTTDANPRTPFRPRKA